MIPVLCYYPPIVDSRKKGSLLLLWRGFLYGKKRRIFTEKFKMKAIEMYLQIGMGSKLIGIELGVTYTPFA